MALHTILPENIHEVDVIVAGGGTSGCVVAARLAEANPDLSILVIERGTNNNLPSVMFPAFVFNNLITDANTMILHKAMPEQQLNNRSVVVESGGVLGGGSSVNMMTYSRPQRSDMDSWGMKGWSMNDMLPFFKKFESYHQEGLDSHGYDGPVTISRGPFSSKRIEDQFVACAAKLGIPERSDLQDFETGRGVQRVRRYVNPNGKRQDVVSQYIIPLLEYNKHKNLHILLESRVHRVLFGDNQRAIGVQFETKSAPGDARTVRASKLVVISSGALGSPPILERSGIGSAKILEKAGIPTIVDSPGVGHDYQDHPLMTYPYQTALEPNETLDVLAQGRLDPAKLIQEGDPILGWSAQDATAKLRPTEVEVAMLGPEFEAAWEKHFRHSAERPISILSTLGVFGGDPTSIPPGQYLTVSAFTLYPFSRGSVHISGPGQTDAIDFRTGFLKDPIDVQKAMWTYKKQREIVRRMPIYRGEVAFRHPPFHAESNAAAKSFDKPLPEDVPDITYTLEDDSILEAWLRQNVSSTWHGLGTCKMAPKEEMGVVDEKLNVYGTVGLKVVDLSVVPVNFAANSNSVALAIAEKAASIIIDELGIAAEERC